MSYVTAKVASTLLIGVAAATVSTALPSRSVNAADSCLTEPKGDTQGKHWYYHIERGTGRHCWYQRSQDDDTTARADDDKQAASDEAPSSKLGASAARTFADAHAEIAPKAARPDSTNAAAAPSVWPAPQASNAPANNATETAPAQAAPDSALAARWPQAADAAAPAPSAIPQPDATLMAADAQDNSANANAANASDPPPDSVPAPPVRQMGSIQKLLMVAFGALTLAGLTGSAVYRLGRRRRRNDWLHERNAWQVAQNPNRPPWVDEPRLHSNQDVADLDDRRILDHRQAFADRHVREPESDFSLAMSETEAGSDRVEKIEDFLARLTEQLHQELESSRPHRA
jgi:hypothetical protein